jgi:hypothetical protein
MCVVYPPPQIPDGLQVDSISLCGLHLEKTSTYNSVQNPSGVHMESTWNPPGIHLESDMIDIGAKLKSLSYNIYILNLIFYQVRPYSSSKFHTKLICEHRYCIDSYSHNYIQTVFY